MSYLRSIFEASFDRRNHVLTRLCQQKNDVYNENETENFHKVTFLIFALCFDYRKSEPLFSSSVKQ